MALISANSTPVLSTGSVPNMGSLYVSSEEPKEIIINDQHFLRACYMLALCQALYIHYLT